MKQLVLPNSNTYLVDGSVVTLARFPGMKWIVHYGWYTYKGSQKSGWYFSSIPEQTVIPVNDADLRTLTVLSGSCECNCPPGVEWDDSTCPPPGPPGPKDSFTPKHRWELDRAALSVNTIAERDLLTQDRLLPDGKLVRVSECPDGKTRYFAWNQATQSWDEESFGSGVADAYTREEADAKFATKDDVAEEVASQVAAIDIDGKVHAAIEAENIPGTVETLVDEKINELNIDQKVSDSVAEAIEAADIPSIVQTTIQEDETVKAAIQAAAEEVVPPIVDAHMEELTQKVDTLSDKVEEMSASSSWEPLPEVTT